MVDGKLTDIPNGFVVRSPSGRPILIDFEDGKVADVGVEIDVGNWLKDLGSEIPDDVVVLVHSVRGEDDILIKSLEINHLIRDGVKITVHETAKMNALPKIVETLREKYVERIRSKEVDKFLEQCSCDIGEI